MGRRIPATAVLIFWTTLFAVRSATGSAGPTRLAELLDRSAFVAFSDGDVAASQGTLLQALSNAPAGVAPDDWEYLKPGEVSRCIETGSPDRDEYLENLIAKLSQDHSPFENAGLVELRRAARHYQVVLENQRRRSEVRDSFDRARRTLREALARYQQSGGPDDFERIAAEVLWLERNEQATEFVRAAREELSLPNLEIRLPAELIRVATQQQAPPQTEAIDRNSEGIQTSGTMDVRGGWYLEPTSAQGGGILIVRFQGEVNFSAVNTRRRIQFRNSGLSRVAAVAQIAIDNRPFVTADVLQADASTGVRNERATVDQCLLRRPIGRLADRAIARKTPEVEANLSREVSDGARAKLKAQLDETTAKANAFLSNDLLARARRLDLTPGVRVSTTAAELRLVATEDAQCGLAASQPAGIPDDGAGWVALHESLATDLMNGLYVGQKRPRTVDVNSFQLLNEAIQDTLPVGPFRDAGIRDRDDVNLTLELDFPRPFRVAFRDGVFSLKIRARELRLRDKPALPAHDVTLDYRVTVAPGGVIEFKTQGEPRVSPRDPGRVAAAEVVATVRNELFANLRPVFTVEPSKLFGATQPLPLGLRSLNLKQGWLIGSIDVSRGPDRVVDQPLTQK